MVNRLWKLVFGQALVTTPDDFGSQGAWPTHPELLDWLACEFIDDGWDIKAMLKRMVMTETYRQSSAAARVDAPARSRQPVVIAPKPLPARCGADSRWRTRLQRPALRRDRRAQRQAVPAAGLLGLPQFPPASSMFPTRETTSIAAPFTPTGSARFLHPSLLAFDASTREECVVQRPRSNTPLQALVLLNDPSYVEAARGLAARLIRDEGDPRARLDRAFQLVLSRPAAGQRGRRPHGPLDQALQPVRRSTRRRPCLAGHR